MELVTVFNSYLTGLSLNKYFSPAELTGLVKNCLPPILNQKYQFGEPLLNMQNIFCSISHSYQVGLAVSADFPVGSDIEKIREHDQSLLNYISSSEEQDLFAGEEPNILVTKIWVIKESVSKAMGVGIFTTCKNINIKKLADGYIAELGNDVWFVKIFQIENYIGAYCFPIDRRKNQKINLQYLI